MNRQRKKTCDQNKSMNIYLKEMIMNEVRIKSIQIFHL